MLTFYYFNELCSSLNDINNTYLISAVLQDQTCLSQYVTLPFSKSVKILTTTAPTVSDRLFWWCEGGETATINASEVQIKNAS